MPTVFICPPLPAQFVNTATQCATSVDGTVVGLPNPLTTTIASPQYGTGTMRPGTYYLEYTWYQLTTETLASPQQIVQLTGNGGISVAIPSSGLPAGALGMKVYIGTTSGGETLQGSSVGSASFVQSSPTSATGVPPPASNTTICQQVANDAVWPTGTGYGVTLSDRSGNAMPGYPMQWQIMGPGSTVNLSSGVPYYHGVVMFPTPVMASPLNHNTQSVSGSLDLGMYPIVAGDFCVRGTDGTITCGGSGGGGGWSPPTGSGNSTGFLTQTR